MIDAPYCGSNVKYGEILQMLEGIEPPIELNSKLIVLNEDNSPSELGRSPIILFLFKSRAFSLVRKPIDDGTLPVSLLTLTCKVCKSDKYPIVLGITPVNEFEKACNITKSDTSPIETGRDP